VVYANGSDTYGTHSAYWAYRGLFTLAETAGEATRDSVAAMWREHERRLVAQQRDLRGLLAGDAAVAQQDAVDIACRYSAGAVFEALEMARTTRDRLMTELTQSG